MSTELRRPDSGPGTLLQVTPQSAGWEYLAFAVVEVGPGTTFADDVDGRETAIVPLAGDGVVEAAGTTVGLGRTSVFEQMPRIV